MNLLTNWWARADARWRLRDGWRSDRGDVPGWVLVTLMTAALVVAIWAVAGDRLVAMFNDALDSVTKQQNG